jgi:hypothetical protein
MTVPRKLAVLTSVLCRSPSNRKRGKCCDKKSTLAALLCTVVVAGVGASSAYAGEVTGNGKPTAGPQHANSICVFSGKNDDPTSTDPENPGGVSQSYGQELKLGLQDPHVFNPGDACRGGSNFARQ